MNHQPPRWSLAKEIKKRKTQEVLRAVESRHIQTARPLKLSRTTTQMSIAREPQVIPKCITQTVLESKRTTQVVRVVGHAAHWTRRQKQIAALGAILITSVCFITTLVATSQPISQTALSPLPTTRTGDLIRYLRSVGVPIANLQTFTVPNAMWSANEEVRFDVQQWNGKGIFVVLSYDSPAQVGIDAFKATYDQKFKNWNLVQVSNALVLSSPDTVQSLSAEIASHVTQYLIAPYRSFIPTATPGIFKQ
jgi:hypothetical protein